MSVRPLLLALLAGVLVGCTNPDAACASKTSCANARNNFWTCRRRYDDGNEALSSVLDKLAVSKDAETKLAESAYGEAMSDILLRQAVGIDVQK